MAEKEERFNTVLHIDPQRVLIVDTLEKWSCSESLLYHHLEKSKVLGFDCEWITDKEKKSSCPVSLLQLATVSGLCVLIRLHLFINIPDGLKKILSDKSIIKVGVACLDDSKRLERDYGIHTSGCLDLRHLALRCGFSNSMGFGLKTLASVILNVSLDKRPSIRASNWEANTLSRMQAIYAAKDAVVGAFIFWRLLSIKSNSVSFMCPISKDFSNKLWSFCQGLIDLHYHDTGKSKGKSSKNSTKSVNNVKEPRNRAYVVRQTPLYHNCQMIAPDGQLLCTCDIKKASWYIEKGLAVKVSENPLKLKLTFEPSGRPLEEQNYYTQDKQNICVVCGAEDTYIRKSVIPHEYRKYFPPVMKEHRSHDILLMCLQCHQRSNIYDQILKKELAEKCNAPLDTDKKFQNDDNIMKVKSAARALDNQSKNKSNIPESRLAELRKIICDFYGVNEIEPDIIKSAKDLTYKVRSSSYIPHGDKVVEYISQNEGLIEFERMWRQKFLDCMKPQYLPSMWSVDHHHYQLTNMEYKMKVTAQTEDDQLKFLKS